MIPTIEAKTILQRVSYDSSKWFGIDYNMNLYRGCCHGCIYCDSRSSCYGIENFDQVCVKANAAELLEKELRSKRKTGVIGIGAMSDSYNPFEKELGVTRKALKAISAQEFGVAIPTKSTLILRDMDLLQEIAKQQPVLIKVTVTCCDDLLSKKVEPFAPLSSERMSAISALSSVGIFTGVLMMPILPFINDTEHNLRTIVRMAKDAGARFVSPSFGVTLRDNQRDYYLKRLDERFNGLSPRYVQTYGEKYSCDSPKAKSLYYAFRDECAKQGMLYQMKDIISAYKVKPASSQFCFDV